jgi:hypothetical protein
MTGLVAVTLLLAAAVVVPLRRDLRDAEDRRRIRDAMRAAREVSPLYRLSVGLHRFVASAGAAARAFTAAFTPLHRSRQPVEHRWFYASDPSPCRCRQCIIYRRQPR